MRKIFLIILCLAVLMLAACVQPPQDTNQSNATTTQPLFITEVPDISTEPTPVEEANEPETQPTTPEVEPEQETLSSEDDPVVEQNDDLIPVKRVLEGEKIELKSNVATDPDGDQITFSFGKPLDRNGEWQTAIGDAGEYLVDILASDGDLTSKLQVRIIVDAINAAPVITNFNDATISEGESISFNPTVSDDDGDNLNIEYSGWMTQSSKTTDFDDAGEHQVTLSADDGTTSTSKTVTVTVQNVNRAPELSGLQDIQATEGDLVRIGPQVSDADDDDIIVTFSQPFDEDGEWQTRTGDAAIYPITVKATDGDDTVEEKILVTVSAANFAPTIDIEETIIVTEGETVELSPVVKDADGDEIRVSYSGWMTSETKETDFDDAGEYTVTIVADDGNKRTTQDVTVIVQNTNRPPVFSENPFN